jgi:hypothetical protein
VKDTDAKLEDGARPEIQPAANPPSQLTPKDSAAESKATTPWDYLPAAALVVISLLASVVLFVLQSPGDAPTFVRGAIRRAMSKKAK